MDWIRGQAECGYGRVVDVVAKNFRDRREMGAACAVSQGGRSEIDGPRLLSTRSIDDATAVQSTSPQMSGAPNDGSRWGTGFQLASSPPVPMLGPRSFGHAGAGAQLAFGDDEYGMGFEYLSSQMGGYGDARARELAAALSFLLRSRPPAHATSERGPRS